VCVAASTALRIARARETSSSVRRVERAGRTGGSARGRHPAKVERQEHVLAAPGGESGGGVVGESICGAGETAAELAQRAAELGGLRLSLLGPSSALPDAHVQRCGDRHGGVHVLASGAATPFLRAAMELRVDARAVANVQSATAAGAELVPAQRNEIGALGDVNPPWAGTRVDVNERTDCVRALNGLGHGLDGPDLVVREPDGNQADAGLDRVQVDRCVVIGGSDRHRMSCRLEVPRGGQDGLVLSRPCDDGRLLWEAMRGAEDGKVDGLGARGGEGDLSAVRPKGGREQVTGGVESCAGRATLDMEARRISVRNAA